MWKDTLIKVEKLIGDWRKTSSPTESEGRSPTPILNSLSELFESEIDKFLDGPIESADTFKGVESLRTAITSDANQDFIQKVVSSYVLGDESEEVREAAMRLLASIVPEELGFLKISKDNGKAITSKLFEWAMKAEEPFQSYTIGLLSSALEVEELVDHFKKEVLKFIPHIMKELHDLKRASETGLVGVDFGEPGKKASRLDKINPMDRMKRVYCLEPLTVTVQEMFRLRCLAFLCFHRENLQSLMLKEGIMDPISYFCDFRSNQDIKVTTMCHLLLTFILPTRKTLLDFLTIGGLDKMLTFPVGRYTTKHIAWILSAHHLLGSVLEGVFYHPSHTLSKLLRHVLAMIQFPDRVIAGQGTKILMPALNFPVLLIIFHELDGLQITLDLIKCELDNPGAYIGKRGKQFLKEGGPEKGMPLHKSQLILKKYLFGNLYMKMYNIMSDRAVANGKKALPTLPLHKELEMSRQTYLDMEAILQDEITCSGDFDVMQKFKDLDAVKQLLQLVSVSPSLSLLKPDKCDMVMDVFKILKVLVHASDIIPQLCQAIPCENHKCALIEEEPVGIRIILAQVQGRFLNDEKIKCAAFELMVKCISPSKVEDSNEAMAAAKRLMRQHVREYKGFRILMAAFDYSREQNLVDSYRRFAAEGLLGMVYRDEEIRETLSKIPFFRGKLQGLMKRLGNVDLAGQRAEFYKYGQQLLDVVTGPSVSSEEPQSKEDIEKPEKETKVQYSEVELFELMHEHLMAQGLTETAESLLKEAKLSGLSADVNQLSKDSSLSANIRDMVFTNAEAFTKFPFSSQVSLGRQAALPPVGKIKMKWNKVKRPHVHTSRYQSDIATVRNMLSKGPGRVVTFQSIMDDYLKDERDICEKENCICPVFSVLESHTCASAKHRMRAPSNVLPRQQQKQICPPNGGVEGRRFDKQRIYSRLRPLKILSSKYSEGFTKIKFDRHQSSMDQPTIMIGTVAGRVQIGVEVRKKKVKMQTFRCLDSPVSTFDLSKDNSLLLASGAFGDPRSALWKFENNHSSLSLKHTFQRDDKMCFGNVSDDKMLASQGLAACVYDTNTGEEIVLLKNTMLSNCYSNNYVSFDQTDTLVLSNGILWDVRSGGMLHKFDKLSKTCFYNGKIHPSGLHVLINSAMWDMRTYKLMTTVPEITNICEMMEYSMNGDVLIGATSPYKIESIYGLKKDTYMQIFDPDDYYRTITSMNLKYDVLSLDVDPANQLLAVNQPQQRIQMMDYRSICQIYEIGRPLTTDPEDEVDEDIDDIPDSFRPEREEDYYYVSEEEEEDKNADDDDDDEDEDDYDEEEDDDSDDEDSDKVDNESDEE
ncbi:DDB1- and CUL4-associated factor 1-like isoform X1 [Ptychodera flava]|uniref:DDB1- and CUL4-associated factor 1-like isoform X1 n=1 Tax=Ptychodera flava TaxID=63121 RepID=UPI00396A001F